MIIQFIHLILLYYAVAEFAGSVRVMSYFAVSVWLFLSMLLLFRWLPNYADSYIESGRVPDFFKAYNIFCFIIVLWVSLLLVFISPLSLTFGKNSSVPGIVMPNTGLLLLSMFLYLIFLKPFMGHLYRMLSPVLPEEQSFADFYRARLSVPIIFFPPVLMWSILEESGLGKGMELLTEIESMIVAPLFLICLYLFAPRLLGWAWRGENAGVELSTRINELCKRAETKIAGVKIWNTFKEPVANAAVSGLFGNIRFIFVTDYLLRIFTAEEMESVIAHELGHFRLGHVVTYMLFSIDAILLAVLVKCWAVIYLPYFYVHSTLTYVLEFVLFIPVFAILFTAMTRYCEKQADAFAVAVTNKDDFCRALNYIDSISTSLKWIPYWLQTHPKISERINNVKNNEISKISSLVKGAKVLRYTLLIVAIVLILLAPKPISIVLKWSNLYKASQAGNCNLVENLSNSLPEWLKEHPFVIEQKEKVAVK